MSTGWVYHDAFLDHRTDSAHPERPERLAIIIAALDEAGLLQRMTAVPFNAADPATVALIHDPAYVGLVNLSCRKGIPFIGSTETYLCRRTYDVALLAVGGVIAACDQVMARSLDNAFCAVRPPGHHAGVDYAMGFCIFNNAAIAAEHLIRNHGIGRVAIVDVDVHHGNGTQQIFDSRADVLYVSLHGHPTSLFPGTGLDTDRGCAQGNGYTLNIPMFPGSDDAAYHEAFETRVLPRLDEFQPEFVLMSTGFDAVRDDEMAQIDLKPESFGWMTRALLNVASRHCGGRLVSVLEGGYTRQVLRASVVPHVSMLLDAR
jgi:acetoin utilization deacetylase AcuC-like enzyme